MVKCKGITKNGTQCSRDVHGTECCYQHKSQVVSVASPRKISPERKYQVSDIKIESLIPDLNDLTLSYLPLEEIALLYKDPVNIDLIIKKYPVGDLEPYMEVAIKTGNLDLLKYLIYKGIIPNREDLNTAVENNQNEIVKYILDLRILGVRLTHHDLGVAVDRDNVDLVRYFVEELNFEDIPLSRASRNGSFKVLAYLIGKGFKDPDLISGAIYENRLDVVKFLVEQMKIKPKKSDLVQAFEYREKHIVKYLESKGVTYPVNYVKDDRLD